MPKNFLYTPEEKMATVKGTKEKGWLEFKYRNTGEPIRFPVGTIYGAFDGPNLVVLGGMHGCEYCGIEAAIRLFNEVDPAKLSGTLKVGTIYNMPAHVNNAGFVVPQDGKNPMSTFPGTPIGTYGEAMAYYFDQEVLSKADYFVELHGGDLPEALAPFNRWVETGNAGQDAKGKAMAQAYNIPLIVKDPYEQNIPPNAAYIVTAGRGKPAILCESGQQGILDMHYVNIHLTGLRNILIHLGMMPGTIVNTVKRFFLDNYIFFRADMTGLWYPEMKCGEILKKGQVAGHVRGYFGEELQEVKAPIEGVITCIRTSPNIMPGNVIFEISAIASREE
jgi:predicted deacylase